MSASLKILAVFSLFILTTSCKEIEGHIDLPAVENPKQGNEQEENNPPPTSLNVCYLKSSSQAPLCPPLTETIVPEEQSHYTYKAPTDENDFPPQLSKTQYRPATHFIDLDGINTEQKLSENFKLYEFMSRRKGRYAIFSPKAVEKMQAIRDHVGHSLTINSGYRSPGYNQNTSGAAKWSRHMYGDAVDFFSNNDDLVDLAEVCIQHNASFIQLYSSHVHCDWRAIPVDEAFFGPDLSPALSNFSIIQSAMQQQMSLSTEIVDQQLQLNALNVNIEDQEDQLLYHWEVILPNQTKIITSQKAPRLPLLKGAYQVLLRVGESLEKEFFIQPYELKNNKE